MITFLLMSENFLDDFEKIICDKLHPIHKLSLSALSLLLDRLDDYLEKAIHN